MGRAIHVTATGVLLAVFPPGSDQAKQVRAESHLVAWDLIGSKLLGQWALDRGPDVAATLHEPTEIGLESGHQQGPSALCSCPDSGNEVVPPSLLFAGRRQPDGSLAPVPWLARLYHHRHCGRYC